MHVLRLLMLVAVLLSPVIAPSASTGALVEPITTPTVVFDLSHPSLSPSHYTITLPERGGASYTASGDGVDTVSVEFTPTPETVKKIFSLAERARYFNQDCEFESKVAFSGDKTLRYRAPQGAQVTNGQCKFNYSGDPAVQQLTATFQAIAATMQFAQRLQHKLRFDKLSLHDEMKSMEDMFNRGMLAEVQAIAPVLQQVAEDTSVVRTARERARKMLRRSASN